MQGTPRASSQIGMMMGKKEPDLNGQRNFEQQRREISEDRAKLEELRSKCKIREETYKVEIEKLRQKLEKIRFKFEQQQKYRQNSQEVQRLKEENIFLRSQVQYQKQQIQHSFQTSNLLQTSRENSLTKQHGQSSKPITNERPQLNQSSDSSSKATSEAPSKKIIASDVQLVKVAQHKLMKENRSLKKRVDIMQSQMKELYEILIEEKMGQSMNNNQQKQETPHSVERYVHQDVSEPRQSREFKLENQEQVAKQRINSREQESRKDISSHRLNSQGPQVFDLSGQRGEQVFQSSPHNVSDSRIQRSTEFAQFQDKIESTKHTFLNKIKTVFQKHSQQSEVYERNNNKIKEISQQLFEHKKLDKQPTGSQKVKQNSKNEPINIQAISNQEDEKNQIDQMKNESSLSSSLTSSSSPSSLLHLEQVEPLDVMQNNYFNSEGRSFKRVQEISSENGYNLKEAILQNNEQQQKGNLEAIKERDSVSSQPFINKEYQSQDNDYDETLSAQFQYGTNNSDQVNHFKDYDNQMIPSSDTQRIEKRIPLKQNDFPQYGEIQNRYQDQKDSRQMRSGDFRCIKDQYESLLAQNISIAPKSNNYLSSNNNSFNQEVGSGIQLGSNDLLTRRYDHLNQFQVPKYYSNQIGINQHGVSGNSSHATTNYTNCYPLNYQQSSNNPSGIYSANISKNVDNTYNTISNKTGGYTSRYPETSRPMKNFDVEFGGYSAQISPKRAQGISTRRDYDSCGSQSLHFTSAQNQKKEGSLTSRNYEQKLEQLNKVAKSIAPSTIGSSNSQQQQQQQSQLQQKDQQQNEKITDEYIKQIIQQYKTPKKSPSPPAPSLQNTLKKQAVTTAQPIGGTKFSFDKRDSSVSRIVQHSQPPPRLHTSRLYEKDPALSNNFLSSHQTSSAVSSSPSRMTKVQIPQLVQKIAGLSPTPQNQLSNNNSLINSIQQLPSKDVSTYTCYFGNNPVSIGNNPVSIGNNYSCIGSNNFGNVLPSNINPSSSINSTFNNNANLNQNLISSNNPISQNNSPLSRKIGITQPPTSTISGTINREPQSLNHKRQQSCGGSGAAINKYNLKLNLTSLVTPKSSGLLQSDRQHSDRSAYSRLLPKAAMIVSSNISPKYSPISSQAISTNRFSKK